MTNKKLLIIIIATIIIAFYSSSLLKLTGFTTLSQCSDGIDNDNDGLIDYPSDLGCSSNTDDREITSCQDTYDNDNDGKIDYPADPGCATIHDGSEKSNIQCDDSIDNDNDQKIDYPADIGCLSLTDNTEICEGDLECSIDCPQIVGQDTPRCSSTGNCYCGSLCQTLWYYDNDHRYCQQKEFCGAYMYQGLKTFQTKQECEQDLGISKCSLDSDCNIDCPQVIGQDTPRCSSIGDCYCGPKQCDDSIDNDNDQKIDYPSDTGCFSSLDNTETCSLDSECKIVCLQVIGADTPRCSSIGNCYCGSRLQCNDGLDNDNDNLIDYPADTGCFSLTDNSETCSSNSECSIGCTTSTKCSSTGDCYCESIPLSKCGNGEIDKGELCDTTELQDHICEDFAEFEGGTLKCNTQCHFDTSECEPEEGYPPTGDCGDNEINPGEECEPGNPDILNDFTCQNAGYSSGSLECYSSNQNLPCFFDTSDCSTLEDESICGNSIKEPEEQCDGSDLNDQTCQTLIGYNSGTLSCDSECKYDRTNCTSTVTDGDCSWSCFAPSECSSAGQQTKICTFTGEEYSDSCLSLIDEDGSCSSSFSETKATLTCPCIPEAEIPFFTLTSLILSIFLLISYYIYKIKTS